MAKWREQIEDMLSDEIGMLAPMVIDEVLSDLKISESSMSGNLSSKFIKLLEKKTKNDIANPKLLRQIYKVLLDLPY